MSPQSGASTLSLLSFVAPASAQVHQEEWTLRVGSPGEGVILDGRVEEPPWRTSDSIPQLTMIEPVEGGELTGRTTVRVLADEDALYIGIVAYDPEPGRVVSVSKQRDPPMTEQDYISLLLDTNLDGRSAYTLAINPTAEPIGMGSRGALTCPGAGFSGLPDAGPLPWWPGRTGFPPRSSRPRAPAARGDRAPDRA